MIYNEMNISIYIGRIHDGKGKTVYIIKLFYIGDDLHNCIRTVSFVGDLRCLYFPS
jgi:hypothetical protein